MATSIALPAARRKELGPDILRAFQAFKHRFVWQARTAAIVVGSTGFYAMTRVL